jgi:hypothetical protein
MRAGTNLIAVLVLTVAAGAIRAEEPAPLPAPFPFVLPWDDALARRNATAREGAAPSVANVSDWLPKPAGAAGRIRAGDDGHLYAGRERIRFFGVNLCFGASFPRHADAEKIAARMAKFGINVVRFHHMDNQPFPNGIRARDTRSTRELDPEALERLDYLVAQLKRHGIYANLNLLVSRPFNATDGLPAEIERLEWKERAEVGFFYSPILELQKEYARKLLTHRNPQTGLTYAEDPAVGFVEINNENGLIQAWLSGHVDRIPEIFLSELRAQWNEWLRQRSGSTDKLRAAWNVKEEPLGAEMLQNGDFAAGLKPWRLEQHQGAQATAEFGGFRGAGAEPRSIATDSPRRGHDPAAAGWPSNSVQITVTKPGTAGWHVQFNQAALKLQADRSYTLSFSAKADRQTSISVNAGQAHEPWLGLGLSSTANLTTQWQPFRFVFKASQSDDNGRVSFSGLGQQTGTCRFADVSLRPGGVIGLNNDERIEDGSLPVFLRSRFGERTVEAQRDWMRFLSDAEDHYWQAMYRYLKDDLKVRAVVIGTIVGCSTPNLMAKFDAVDTHAYWQHPQFPGRPWDSDNWIVDDKTMVNEPGGTLPGLALKRVLGKPHCVTEYNHPAPNTYSSEGFLLLAAYAALQDWDAIYAFAYSHRRDDWDVQRIPSFFDIDQHPAKMATLIPAVAMFVRGDVAAAREQVVAALDKQKETDLLRGSHAWNLVDAGMVGIPRETALLHRVCIDLAGAISNGVPSRIQSAPTEIQPAARRFVSDTGELVWDLSEKGRGVVTVNAPRSKAVIGYGSGKRFELGNVVIEPGNTMQDGWSAITVTEMQPQRWPRTNARGWLITATGYTENTGMGWKSPDKNSVGRNWGKAPSLVEGIRARITLPVPARRIQAWSLDERGQRKTVIPVQADGSGNAVVTIGPGYQTLWYEVAAK